MVNAHRINAGNMPEAAPRGTESNFHWIAIDEPEPAVQTQIEVVTCGSRPGTTSIRSVTYRCSPRCNAACWARATSTTNSRQC